jgi:hypothetical protein
MSVVLIHQGASLTQKSYEEVILAPILKEVGIDAQPEVYDAHTFVSA